MKVGYNFKHVKKGDIIRSKRGIHYRFAEYNHRDLLVSRPPPELGLKTYSGNNQFRHIEWPIHDNWTIVTPEELKEKELENVEKLYEFTVDGKNLYGTHMATNGEGLWVMDVKGAQPVAIPKSEAKEVVPYSVQVVRQRDRTKVHMMCEKGAVEAGSIYLTDEGDLFSVTKINTETRSTLTFKPVTRILTEKL